jgi:uncharacterized Rmd1/YagE family protein
MQQIVKLSAIRVAKQLDLKRIKTHLDFKTVGDTSSELFYSFESGKYQYYFNYGVIVFSGYTEVEIVDSVKKIEICLKTPEDWLRDDHSLYVIPGSALQFEFEQVIVGHVDSKVIRIAMLNLAQSIALDHYHETSEHLLMEIRGFTHNLEAKGKLSINRRSMLRFIGRALNTNNDIAENIYIFDGPEQVWDDEYLDALHKGLMKHFDLRVRFSEIEYTLRIIEDNLKVFREISQQRESNLLEKIVILLILVEVVNLLVSKVL